MENVDLQINRTHDIDPFLSYRDMSILSRKESSIARENPLPSSDIYKQLRLVNEKNAIAPIDFERPPVRRTSQACEFTVHTLIDLAKCAASVWLWTDILTHHYITNILK